jgi:hypothetical protein
MKKFFMFTVLFLILMAGFMLAQDEGTTIDIDFTVVELILGTSVGGMTINSLTNVLKRWLKADGFWVIALSAVVSAAFVAIYLLPVGWDWLKFVYLTVFVALGANGIYLNPKKRTE